MIETNSSSAASNGDLQAYQEALRTLTRRQRTGTTRSDEGWFDLSRHLTQTVIQNAFGKQSQAIQSLTSILEAQQCCSPYELHHRKVAKSFLRVSDELRTYRRSGSSPEEAALRVNSDLVVVRIVVPSSQDISTVVGCLEAGVLNCGKSENFIIRKPTSVRAQPDVDYCHLKIYLASLGYVVGIQVGLKFTFYVFAQLASTAYRPDPVGRVVRLWKLYRVIKSALIERIASCASAEANTTETTGDVKAAMEVYLEWMAEQDEERGRREEIMLAELFDQWSAYTQRCKHRGHKEPVQEKYDIQDLEAKLESQN